MIEQKYGWAIPNSNLCWHSPEELVSVGFERSRVLMMNEAHNGLARNIRSREIGRRILPSAHAAGVRHIAMEALTPSVSTEANSTRQLPSDSEAVAGYLAQPEMRAFIQEALDLGWKLIPYEIDFEKYPSTDTLSLESSNLRERVQAENLAQALQELPSKAKLLVWCGNSHHLKTIAKIWNNNRNDELILMGYHFVQLSGIEHFAIDQTLSIDFSGNSGQQNQFASFVKDLVGWEGTAGFLVEDRPPSWCLDEEIRDAIILSTQNELE